MDKRTATGVSYGFVAGYVDTLGFVALGGLFVAHVTGNIVLIGASLATTGFAVLIKLLAFLAFVFSVICTRLVLLRIAPPHQLPWARGLQIVLLLAFMAAGLKARPIHDIDAPLVLLAGMLGVAAMAVQNAVGRILLPTHAPTTVMTGNVTQLVIDVTDLVRGAGSPETRLRAQRYFWPLVSFAFGAIPGAFAWFRFSFWGLLVPVLVLAVTLRWQAE